MPFNPSPRQSEASRRNLLGHEGPRTPEGKARSAANGARNKGANTARARARVIQARHGLNEDSWYAAAGCLGCGRECHWPSFADSTPHSRMPLPCLERVLTSRPERCFYHLEGLCLADFHQTHACPVSDGTCVTDPSFPATLGANIKPGSSSADRKELAFRRRIMRLAKEAKHYLAQLRADARRETRPHPRMVRVLRQLRLALNGCRACKYTQYKDSSTWDHVLEAIADGSLLAEPSWPQE